MGGKRIKADTEAIDESVELLDEALQLLMDAREAMYGAHRKLVGYGGEFYSSGGGTYNLPANMKRHAIAPLEHLISEGEDRSLYQYIEDLVLSSDLADEEVEEDF